MLRGFWKLTWLEIKIFVREPLGVLGSVVIPVAMFLVLGRALGSRSGNSDNASRLLSQDLPIFASVFIAMGAAMSLVAIVTIYREGGILKRLRATPLRPTTILGAHVLVKLLFTSLSLSFMVLAGRRFYPVTMDLHLARFAVALLITTLSIISIGFVIASIVPTARFAQPIGSVILYPMLAISGIFVPLESMPDGLRAFSSVLPLTHGVSLLRGAWAGESWLDHLGNLGVLGLTLVVCTLVSAKIFRWE